MDGQIIILNGAPRAGKSSILRAVQERSDDVWINLGVDVSIHAMLPEKFWPGIGVRPGGERPDLEPLVVQLYVALFESIAAHARAGVNVVAEFGLHEDYSQPLNILRECIKRLSGLPVLFVGVHCELDEIMLRRGETVGEGRNYEQGSGGEVPDPVKRWQEAVHAGKRYDLEVDTTRTGADTIADDILTRVKLGPAGTAFQNLADR